MTPCPQQPTHSLALNCSSLPAQDVLELGEVLDEGHHLRLEALGVDVLHRGHLERHLYVTLPIQVRIKLTIPLGDKQFRE